SPINGQTSSSFNPQSNGIYYVIVTQGLCESTSSCHVFNIVGINDNSNSTLENIYPNPADTKLNLFLKKSGDVILFNSLGETIFKETFTMINRNVQIDISSLSKGIYFIQTDQHTFKFVKN
ncbi:MAG: T9SS type A sorting domain-containing protein, partial [Bacteroidota bacterium]